MDRRFETALEPVASSAAAARRTVQRVLTEWGLRHLEEPVVLLTTELVSNGVRHARTELVLSMHFDGSCLRVSLFDEAIGMPAMTKQDDVANRGWGLRLVDTVASNWGTTVEPTGKTVWFEISALDDLVQSRRPETSGLS